MHERDVRGLHGGECEVNRYKALRNGSEWMKLLFYLSYVLTAPFYALSFVLVLLGRAACWMGDVIHEGTTYRAWRVLHRRRVEMDGAKASRALADLRDKTPPPDPKAERG